jgi:hypothetical protein
MGAAARRRSGIFNPNGTLQGLMMDGGGGGGGGNHMMNGQQHNVRSYFNGAWPGT